MFTCVETPYTLAFIGDGVQPSSMTVIEAIIDVAFTIDIVLNFFTAFYTNDYELVDDRKVISSWLISL